MNANAHSLIWRMCFSFFAFSFCFFLAHSVWCGWCAFDWLGLLLGGSRSPWFTEYVCLAPVGKKALQTFHLSWSWWDSSATHPPLSRQDGMFSNNLEPLVDFWCCWKNNKKKGSCHPLRDLSDTVMQSVLRCPLRGIFMCCYYEFTNFPACRRQGWLHSTSRI